MKEYYDEILLFSTFNSKRLQYVCYILGQRLGVNFKITNSWRDFEVYENVKINYSNQCCVGALNIIPHPLLQENDIHEFDYQSLEKDDFAMIFFLISRYEEYLCNSRDLHDRFLAKDSYLYHTNRLYKPWVDILIEKLKKEISEKSKNFKFHENEFKTQFTIDIDQAFCYKDKFFKRFIGANIRDVLKLNFKNLIDRNLCYFKLKQDPWDIFSNLRNKFMEGKSPLIFFFLMADYGTYDKNIHYENKNFQKAIKSINKWADIGIHPSYQSGNDIQICEKEKVRLEKILNTSVTKSRQHFIKLNLPHTYKNLIKIGVKEDYTMGFSNDIGFRAGTSFPFKWFDLERDEITELLVHPFCAMDITLKEYLKLNITEADSKLSKLKKNVQKVGGVFMIIVHNESLSGYNKWKNWNNLLLKYWE